MRVKVITDTTLTVKAGQTVEVTDKEAAVLLRLGRVEEVKAEAPKKTSRKAGK